MSLEQDGLLEVKAEDEWQCLPAYIIKAHSVSIAIPKAIAAHMKLENGNIIIVAIKKARPRDIREAFGFLRPTRFPINVKCPKCQEWGLLQFAYSWGSGVAVLHRKFGKTSYHGVRKDKNWHRFKRLLWRYKRIKIR